MHSSQKGFTLIELMIVVAIVGILSAVAVPIYQEYMIRTRTSEGLSLSADAKAQIRAGSGTSAELSNSAAIWNAQAGSAGATSKYVNSVIISAAPGGAQGEITITYNPTSVGLSAAQTLVLSPWVTTGAAPVPLGASYAASVTGPVDWSCQSATNGVATARNLGGTSGTLPARYAPSECR